MHKVKQQLLIWENERLKKENKLLIELLRESNKDLKWINKQIQNLFN